MQGFVVGHGCGSILEQPPNKLPNKMLLAGAR
jgi:hypothetical protein